MRNKLKKIWNKEDGFTLVELLAVIVILGVILAIAIPGIGNIVDNARTNTEKQQQELVVDAAKMYVLDGNTIDSNGITSEALIRAGYLEEKLDKDKKSTVPSYTVKYIKKTGTTPEKFEVAPTPPSGKGN